MWEKITLRLGKWGFHLSLIFGLLYVDPIAKVFGDEVTGIIKMTVLALFFCCVLVAGDEVILNAEKYGSKLVKIALWFLNIMDSIKAAIKTGVGDKKNNNDGEHS